MWRLLQTAPAAGAFNMALDEALMSYSQEVGAWVLRVYGWSRPTLSFGRNQSARGGYDLARLAESGIDVVRRPTGGRAILHHREVTYAVAGPVELAGDLRESYARINRLLIAALQTLGVTGAVVASDSALPSRRLDRTQPGFTPCFDHPSIGEITVCGQKLVGSAQWRCDGALLQHGSILVEDDQMQISSFLIDSGPPIPRPATLRQTLGRAPAQAEVAQALFDAVRSNDDSGAQLLGDTDALFERANGRVGHYLDQCWTWRR